MKLNDFCAGVSARYAIERARNDIMDLIKHGNNNSVLYDYADYLNDAVRDLDDYIERNKPV